MKPRRSFYPRALTRSTAIAVAIPLVVAFVMTRPWSSRNSFRQMAIFAPQLRIHNFRAMDELFPARTVRKGDSPHHFGVRPRPLPASYTFAGESRSLAAFLERTVTTGWLVLEGNDIVDERYFHGATRSTRHTSWSVAKSVVSLLTGIALQEGRIAGLHEPLERYAPELRGSAYGRVSLHDALTMSSGIAFDETYTDPFADIHLLFARIFYLGESAWHYLASLPARARDGRDFHYISSDTFALGLAMRGATGKSLASYLEQKLWRPLGMERDAYWNTEDEAGAELGFCCLNATLRDFARIGRLVARGGDWDGERIVSAEWIRAATHAEPERLPGKLNSPHRWGYGYQFWIPSASREAVLAAGVWGQFIYVEPALGLVIVKTSVDPDFMAHADEHIAVFQTIADAL